MITDATIVLVHGAGTGPWIWNRVQANLDRPSLAVEVPSREAGTSPLSCAEQLVKMLDAEGVGNVVLVLHSLAGVLAAPFATLLGDRLQTTIFVAAVVPGPGKRFVDAVGFPGGLILRVLFKFNPWGLKPSEAMLRRELCNDLSEADAAELVERYEAEWPGLYLNRVDRGSLVPEFVYIRLVKDCSVPPALQDKMIKQLPNAKVFDLESGHMVMLSRPQNLAEIIAGSPRST